MLNDAQERIPITKTNHFKSITTNVRASMCEMICTVRYNGKLPWRLDNISVNN